MVQLNEFSTFWWCKRETNSVGAMLQIPTNHLQPFCFSLSLQYSINYVSHSTLYYQVGFLWDDFDQLEADISVLSTFQEGWTMMLSRSGVLDVFLTYNLLNLHYVYENVTPLHWGESVLLALKNNKARDDYRIWKPWLSFLCSLLIGEHYW